MSFPSFISRKRLLWIPPELRQAHEISFLLHDEMVRLLLEYEAAKANTVTFKFRDEVQATEFQRLANEHDTIHAMRLIGREDEARRVVLNQITFALTSDLLHHLYEALRCFEKRKIVVAFNLLRKPLLDNLLFLAWLLSDEDGFYTAFSKAGPEALTTKAMGNRRTSVIKGALEKTAVGQIIDPELIRIALFDHRNSGSLYGLFQHAVHLVTIQKTEIATDHENLNFIFKNPADDDLYLDVYKLLPTILLFAAHVVLELFDRVKPMDAAAKRAFTTRSIMGLSLMLDGPSARTAILALNERFMFHRLCGHCDAMAGFTRQNAIGAVMCEKYRCNRCRRNSPFPFSWMF